MCKINGHSLFTYIAQPHNSGKLLESKKVAAQKAKANEQLKKAQEVKAANSQGDELASTATTATINGKKKKTQTLSSLKVPLETSTIGASLGGSNSLGLNLGG